MKRKFRFLNQVAELKYDNADAQGPAEVMLYDSIGKDPWTGGGISAADFKRVLDEVPRDRELVLRVNSKGGDVHAGMAIHNMLMEWPKKKTAIIDGVAASTSSWIPLACDEVHAFRNSQVFIHDAIGFAGGNADDFRDFADNLDKTSDQIAGMYSEKTGKGVRTMRAKMKEETLLTGEEAEELGLVDKIIEGKATRNFAPDEVTQMRNQIAAIYNSASPKGGGQQTNKTPCMNRDQIIALLKEHGVTVANEATDEQLQAALKELLKTKTNAVKPSDPSDVSALKAEIDSLKRASETMTNALNEAKRIRIASTIDTLISNDQLPAALKEKALARAMGDETYLDELRSMPAHPPGAPPLSASRIELTGDSFKDVQNYMLTNGPRFREQFLRNGSDKISDNSWEAKKLCVEIRDRAVIVANTWQKHRKMLAEMFNTNTIDAALQRIVILQEMLEEFAIVLYPFTNFSAVFNNVPLEGTDEVAVPFYPLQAAGQAQSWDPSNGYNTFANTTTNMRKVAVGGSGTNSGSNAAANTAKDRKYIGMSFSSYELARQPYLNVQKLGVQNANRLAVDIFTDIVSRVITAANYAASVKAVPAAAFSGDDVADLYSVATGRNWPARGRSLVLDHTYNAALVKDPTFKQFLSYGGTDPLRQAKIQEAYGFEDVVAVPNLTSYSPTNENLVGWLCWQYALLIATSPIMPTEEVRHLLTRYDVVVHPSIGIALEYRRFGDTTLDTTKEVVECSYGANLGVASALARLTSQ